MRCLMAKKESKYFINLRTEFTENEPVLLSHIIAERKKLGPADIQFGHGDEEELARQFAYLKLYNGTSFAQEIAGISRELIKVPEQDVIVDVGSAHCPDMPEILALMKQNAKLICVDTNGALLKMAKQHELGDLADSVQLREESSTKLSLKDNSVDVLRSIRTLQTMDPGDIKASLCEFSRVTKPGQPVVIIDPIWRSMRVPKSGIPHGTLLDVLQGNVHLGVEDNKLKPIVRNISAAEWTAVSMERAGFKNVETHDVTLYTQDYNRFNLAAGFERRAPVMFGEISDFYIDQIKREFDTEGDVQASMEFPYRITVGEAPEVI